jgi:hypothetical protein
MEKKKDLRYLLSLFEGSFQLAMYFAGPMLISIATGLITYVMCYGIINVVPLYGDIFSLPWLFHSFIAIFLGTNILFNYAACILVDAGSTNSMTYIKLIQEARALGDLPLDAKDDHAFITGIHSNSNTTATEIVAETDPSLRKRGDGMDSNFSPSSSSISPSLSLSKTVNNTNTNKGKGGWLDRGPYEWTWCNRTNQPKAPRSHYDSVTKKQILNMDHFCPWMFRAVGYRNYRYFWLFLFWVWLGCIYCIAMTLLPFLSMTKRRSILGISVPRRSRSTVSFIFIICSSVGCAVSLLFFWHIFLLFSAQTTIEYHGNRTKKRKAKQKGEMYINSYDLGKYRNWCQVFGTGNVLLAILPSLREPAWPPFPSVKRNAGNYVYKPKAKRQLNMQV